MHTGRRGHPAWGLQAGWPPVYRLMLLKSTLPQPMAGQSHRQAMVLMTNAPIGRWALISVEKLAALIEKGFILKPMRRPEDDLLDLLGSPWAMKSSFFGENSK